MLCPTITCSMIQPGCFDHQLTEIPQQGARALLAQAVRPRSQIFFPRMLISRPRISIPFIPSWPSVCCAEGQEGLWRRDSECASRRDGLICRSTRMD
jgi:hypothetical protein